MIIDATKDLFSRHVKEPEAVRLGVVAGWYNTKISGTFVSGPHMTEEEAHTKILELRPPKFSKRKVL